MTCKKCPTRGKERGGGAGRSAQRCDARGDRASLGAWC